MKLIHFGSDAYKASAFKSVVWDPYTCHNFSKPEGGLWLSPMSSGLRWDTWCSYESYNLEGLQEHFTIDYPDERIYTVTEGETPFQIALRIERGMIDAFFLPEERLHDTEWYGWDCETVFIVNPQHIL